MNRLTAADERRQVDAVIEKLGLDRVLNAIYHNMNDAADKMREYGHLTEAREEQAMADRMKLLIQESFVVNAGKERGGE